MANRALVWTCAVWLFVVGCGDGKTPGQPARDANAPAATAPAGADAARLRKVPADAVKITPQTDVYPPKLHAEGWHPPVPVPAPVNTAGAEDSPFVMPDGKTLYVWFTPKTGIPPQKQLLDGVTGCYVFRKGDGEAWSAPERLILQDPGKLALDGGQFVMGDTIWFCSAREGYTGVNYFTAQRKDGKWGNWQYTGDTLNKTYDMGEMHITADGKSLYFHSGRPGGKGKYDIWVSRKADGKWQEPKNVEAVNSEETDGWPFLTQDGNELWFTRRYRGSPAIFRSKKAAGQWQKPEMILSQFAAEPSLDNAGNIYFAHHYFKANKMLEADIYVARKK